MRVTAVSLDVGMSIDISTGLGIGVKMSIGISMSMSISKITRRTHRLLLIINKRRKTKTLFAYVYAALIPSEEHLETV